MIEVTVIVLGILLTLVTIGFIALLIYHLYYVNEYPKDKLAVIRAGAGPASARYATNSKNCPYIGIKYTTTDAELLRVYASLQKTMAAFQTQECKQIRAVFDKTKALLFEKIDADKEITISTCKSIFNTVQIELDTLKHRVSPEYDAIAIINELKLVFKETLDIICVNNMDGKVNKERLKLFIEQVVNSICPK